MLDLSARLSDQHWRPSPDEVKTVAGELLTRRRARHSLIAFTEYTYPRYRTSAHHRLVAAQLERMERREIDRLMLLLPPRHGKTELASRRYPAFALGRNPTRQIIAASAAKEFAGDVGREVRNIIRGEDYQRIFDTTLAEDSQAAGRWHTSVGGVFHAVGVDSQVIGKGADEFIIDDPYGTMFDAQSEAERKRVREWYLGSVYHRLQPGGAICVINHRMHEDDLTGFLLEQQALGGDQWTIVKLPAEAEADDPLGRQIGEALWPDAYPIETLHRIKANSLPRFHSALFQQNPQPDEGTFFQRSWFNRHAPGSEPKVNVFASSDLAVTDEGGDFTEHGIWGVGPDSTLYGITGWWGQTDASVWIEKQLDLAKEHKPLTWFSEAGVIRRAIESSLVKRMQERRVWVSMEWLPSIHDKPTRARGFQALAANKKVSLPLNDWGERVLEQLVRFPGKYDDAVDMAALIGRAIAETHPAIVASLPERKRPDDVYSRARRANLHVINNWKTM
jgi:predicted phage terminase large subunit-like protein